MATESTSDLHRHGFIYPIVCAIVEAARYLNLVELFKAVGKLLTKTDDTSPRNIRIAIDIFIVLKWAFVLWVWFGNISNPVITAVVIYLLVTNLFTYFYYHVWHPPHDQASENLRSRFVSLALAICYGILGFAYLYAVPFGAAFKISGDIGRNSSTLLFSLSRTMLTDFPPVTPTPGGHMLALAQTVSTFIFVTVILYTTIPFNKPREN